jgi:hypothetical protein
MLGRSLALPDLRASRGTPVTAGKIDTYLNIDEVARRGSRKAESFRYDRKDP